MSTPIERLRTEHRHCSCWGENCAVKRHPEADWNSHCERCAVSWPCDTVAALDALEAVIAQLRKALSAQPPKPAWSSTENPHEPYPDDRDSYAREQAIEDGKMEYER